MTVRTFKRATETATIVNADSDTRRVTVSLCRWDDPRTVNDGGASYFEKFSRGSLSLDDTGVHVLDQHHGHLIGRADPDTLRDTPDGPTIELIMSNSTLARDTLADIETGVVNAVSMEFAPIDPPADFVPAEGETVTRNAAVVSGVAFAFRPAHATQILATRDQTPTPEKTMPEDTQTPDPAPTPEVAYVTADALERSTAALRDDFERSMLERTATPAAAQHPASQFRSLGEYTAAMVRSDAGDNLRNITGLADQTTESGANAGVMPPAWLKEVQGIISQSRPVISSIGGGALPASGMEINWPVFDGDLSTIVGEQLVQKTSITSVPVDIKKESTDIRTFAGGSDVAYQLIRRSDPSFLENYMRILMNAWAVCTESVCATELEDIATPSSGVFDPATGDMEAAAEAVFTASVAVEDATGSPASVLLAADDMFIKLGGLGVATTTPYGVQNVAGHAAASTLSVSVAGLSLVHAPALSDGTLIATNPSAASWWEDGPFTISAEDVERLGQDVAVWSMGAFGALIPAGVVSIPAA